VIDNTVLENSPATLPPSSYTYLVADGVRICDNTNYAG